MRDKLAFDWPSLGFPATALETAVADFVGRIGFDIVDAKVSRSCSRVTSAALDRA
jgi:hypothetical protein